MTMMRHPDLRAGTHVVFDSMTSERLSRLGATNVVRVADRLIVGPSRRDAAEHARVREAWWRPSETWDHLHSPEVRWELPVVMWVSPNIAERVNLWRACSRLRQIGVAPRDVFLLEFEPVAGEGEPDEPFPPFDGTSSVSHHSDAVLLERLGAASPWPCVRFDRAVMLWNRYVDVSPQRFARLCARGIAGFPELAPLWMFLSCLYPRQTQEGTLRLSRLDELILTNLSAEWQTTLAVFAAKSQAGVELRQLLSCTGDLFLPRRLNDWAAHGPNAAVERAPGPRPPDYPMLASTHRITADGRRLLEKGLKGLSDAPGLPVAGIEAYGSTTPWVLLDGGRVARL